MSMKHLQSPAGRTLGRWISVIEGDKCFNLTRLTKKKETEYRKPYWKGREALRTHTNPPLQEQQVTEKGW